MKKTYVEPVMIVEDFTVSEMVAKCELITNNTFTEQLSGDVPACAAENNSKNTTAHMMISSFGEGSGDFDNVDTDFGWNTNNEKHAEDTNRHCFLKAFQATGFCTYVADGLTFMDYEQKAMHGVAIPPCSKGDSGSSLLQNS